MGILDVTNSREYMVISRKVPCNDLAHRLWKLDDEIIKDATQSHERVLGGS